MVKVVFISNKPNTLKRKGKAYVNAFNRNHHQLKLPSIKKKTNPDGLIEVVKSRLSHILDCELKVVIKDNLAIYYRSKCSSDADNLIVGNFKNNLGHSICEMLNIEMDNDSDIFIQALNPDMIESDGVKCILKRISTYLKVKQDNVPKRALSPFQLFSSEYQHETRRLCKSEKHMVPSFADINRKAVAKWKSMEPDHKKKFEDKSIEDKTRYELDVLRFMELYPRPFNRGLVDNYKRKRAVNMSK